MEERARQRELRNAGVVAAREARQQLARAIALLDGAGPDAGHEAAALAAELSNAVGSLFGCEIGDAAGVLEKLRAASAVLSGVLARVHGPALGTRVDEAGELVAASLAVLYPVRAGLERVQNVIERYVIDGFRHRQFEESDYVRGVTRVVTTLARRGRVVLLGRGASAIVDPAHALRVFVVAPKAWRAARLIEMHPTTVRAADERIDLEDRERLEFNRRSFRVDPLDPLNYDLVVNTASLGIPASTATIVEAFRRRFAG